MNGKVLCPITSRNIEIHCVSWYFMYILMYRYYLGIQLLQRQYIYIYIYIYIALCICIGGLWYWIARSPFGWHHSSTGTLLVNESANSNLLSSSSSCICLAYFMVTCCINAQASQPFYRYSCLVRLLKCFLYLVLCPSGYHDELILT